MLKIKNIFDKIYIEKKTSATHKKDLEDSLKLVLNQINNETREMNLTEVFNSIGDKLLEKNICSMITVLDDKRENLVIRYFRLKENEMRIIKDFNLIAINKKFPVKKYFRYKEALDYKKTIYCKDCFESLISSLLNSEVLKKNAENKKRILSPLVLRGEVIGFVDFFSPDLEKNDTKLLEKFSRDLMNVVANTILFNEVKKTEEKYQDLFENAQEGFFILNGRHKKLIEVNKGLAEITKYTKGELLQLNYLTLISENEKERINSIIKLRLEGNGSNFGVPRKYETEIITKDGKKKYVRITVTKVINNDEWFCVMSDITKIKKVEDEVHRLSELNQGILDCAPISIVTLNEKGQITSVNKFGEQILSEPLKTILGKKLIDYHEIATKQDLIIKYKKLLEKGESFTYDSLGYFSGKTGEKKYLNIIAVPLFGKEEKIEGAISIGLDNTKTIIYKKQIENLNRNLEKKIRERTKELATANEKLKEVADLKSKFLSDASHELRTPLTIIQGNLDLAIRELQDEANIIPELFDIVGYEVDRMTRIITDLTMLTNTDDGRENLRCEKIDLNELLDRIVKSLEVLAQHKNISIKKEKTSESLVMSGDEPKIEKLFLNIIRNAIKYTDNNGKIEIKTKKKELGIEVSVKDNGIGIPESDLPFIFERFYRADKARSRAEGGTGLGLAISKWIAERHRGSIKVKSVLGEGSTFIVLLPFECGCKITKIK